jgi:adenylate kinase
MRLILLGPPGSGKGTQAKLLSQRLGLAHISTGDILREAVRLKTPAGRLAHPYLDSGQLVPDDFVNEMVADRFRRDDRPEKFVMDGYPRTLAQAASFDQALRQQFLGLDAVVQLLADVEEVVRRLSGRWSCPTCKTPYHTLFKPPRIPGLCDLDGTRLVQREDDKEETIRRRMAVYHENTEALVDYYRRQNLLRPVNGTGDIEAIYARILQALGQAEKSC